MFTVRGSFLFELGILFIEVFMKIEHIAIWVKDIDKVCEFYQKYLGGVVHPLYHNPTKQFTSRFITFDEGARLEVMHRPDIDSNVWTVTKLQSNTHQSAIEKNASIFSLSDLGCVSRETMPDTQHLGFTHLSFSVGSKEEVDRLTQQMSSEGIPVVGQPRTTGDGYYESVVLDPEGNRIEITI
jgi:lactoylglutathione lyase